MWENGEGTGTVERLQVPTLKPPGNVSDIHCPEGP